MPTQVIPVTDLASAGVVMDTPSVSLPPNVFSSVSNVRFRDGAIRKMEGESEIIFNIGVSDLIFVAWWPHPTLSPNDGYYIVVGRRAYDPATDPDFMPQPAPTEVDQLYVFQASDIAPNAQGVPEVSPMPQSTMGGQTPIYPVYDNTFWQNTLFGGGSVFIINNRSEKPKYILNPTNGWFDLPGWDSYLVDERVTSFFYDPGSINNDVGTDVGTFVNLQDSAGGILATNGRPTTSDQNILVSIIPADTDIAPFNIRYDAYGGRSDGLGTVFYLSESDTTAVTLPLRTFNADGTVDQQGVLAGDSVTIRIRTEPIIQVRAGVIRTYGDLLIAGNLTEMTRPTDTQGNPQTVREVRNLPGVIRTSDVAAPGSVPANWNPFSTGVNTADEITLSSTGIIQDMVELQGIMYVYTNESIHSVQNTGNPTVPFNIRPVSRGWGAQTIDAVQEFDGKHVVIGTNDIYVFAGHPGSISSIADARVREFFFNDLSPTHEQNLFTLLYRRRDEIWINYPSRASTDGQCDKTLIWNYRDNTWTLRQQSTFWNGVVSPVQADGTVNPNMFFPLLVTTSDVNDTDSVFVADAPGRYQLVNNDAYESFILRTRLAIAPEFTTEMMASMALLTEGPGARLEVRARGTDVPSTDAMPMLGTPDSLTTTNEFVVDDDYKTDLRVHGRLLNYKISDNVNGTNQTADWTIAGMQLDIGAGGTR